jgi:hypothetical protein
LRIAKNLMFFEILNDFCIKCKNKPRNGINTFSKTSYNELLAYKKLLLRENQYKIEQASQMYL